MSRTDPIADFLTLIRNACRAKKAKVDVPNSKMNGHILEILKREGYIADYKRLDSGKGEGQSGELRRRSKKLNLIRIYLKYAKERSVITNLKRASRPGLRFYASSKDMPRVLRGLGVAIISTSGGIVTDKEAREKKVGGEVLCYVW